jgi:predicted RNA-binding protein with PUA-like domain
LALKNLRTFRRGDVAIIYHTGTERAAVGLPEVLTDAYPDPKQKDPKLVVVDLRAKGRFAPAVTLDEIKKAATLKDFDLVRLPRLFVMSVSEAQCKAMVAMAAKPPA